MRLEILDINQTLYQGEAMKVSLPGYDGGIEILPHHADLIIQLKEGNLSYQLQDKEEQLAIDGGYAIIKEGDVTICINRKE